MLKPQQASHAVFLITKLLAATSVEPSAAGAAAGAAGAAAADADQKGGAVGSSGSGNGGWLQGKNHLFLSFLSLSLSLRLPSTNVYGNSKALAGHTSSRSSL